MSRELNAVNEAASIRERLHEIAYRDTAVSVMVRTDDLRAILAAHVAAAPAGNDPFGLESYKRMWVDACAALAEVSRELGCDPDQGGAEPILAAIAELKASTPAAPGIDLAEVVYKLARDFGFTDAQADAWLDEQSKLFDASTPAAPSLVELLIEIRNRLHAMSCRVGDEWEAEASELQGDVQKIIDSLIDASLKGE